MTLDALGCQKDIVAQIVDKKGDYVIAVKGNQEKLEVAVHPAFGEAMETQTAVPTITRVERKHGRKERRLYTVLPVPGRLPRVAQRKGLRSLVMVAREYEDAKHETQTGVRTT